MRTTRGFTLLEVMVAMAILAMGLTIILSSQASLFAATQRVQLETHAASLMRCKMSEIELQLLEEGFPLVDRSDSGDCCEDADADFKCEWTIQTIELPQPADFTDMDGEDGATSGAAPPGTPLGDAAALSPMDGSALAGIDGMGDLAGTLGESAQGGGMISMALGLVYPTLKPMLEASIRKVQVDVIWREGSKERRFEVTQYITNPLEGGLNPNAAEGLDEIADLMGGGVLRGGPSGSTGDSSGANSPGRTNERGTR
jgi:general secretion pathway protein I